MEFRSSVHATPSATHSARMKNKIVKSERIKTYLRVRPLNEAEIIRGSHVIVDCAPNSREVTVNERPCDKITRKFTFDRVFGPSSKQIELYKCVAAPLIKEVLDGYNCTIFAYGQTGAGKTYTMEGKSSKNPSITWNNDPHSGIIPRAVCHLFDELRLLQVEYSVKASFLEIYNEELFDLLSPVDDTNKLRLYEDAVKKGAIIVNGLGEVVVRSKEEVHTVLEKGTKKRQTAATLMNASSSRSHTVFSVTVRIKENGVEEDEELVRTGKLNLVDLAGSENISRSGAIDKRAREAGNINQSLLTLGRVITALVEKTPHIPYRESKLTRLLQESLGGRTKTCIIATISPSQCSMEETLSTLDYAHRAKNIQNKPEINQKIGKAALIQEYIEEIERLKADLMASRQKSGVYLAEENYNEMINQIECQKRELSGLIGDMKNITETLERKEELNRELNEYVVKYRDELHDANVSLAECDALLQHRVETEQKLSKQAESLLCVADTVTNHVHLLHETLGRKRKLEANNLAACKNLSSLTQNKLHGLKETVISFQENSVRTNQNILNLIGKGQKITEVKTQEMKASAEDALQTLGIQIKGILENSENMKSQTEMTVDSTKSSTIQCNDLNIKNYREALEYVFDKVQQISSEISCYRSEHQENAKQLTDKFQEREDEIKNFIESVNRHVTEANEQMETHETILRDASESLTKHKKKMSRDVNAALQLLQDSIQSNLVEYDARVNNVKSSFATADSAKRSMKNIKLEVNNMMCNSGSGENSIYPLLNASINMAVPVINKIECALSEINEGIDARNSEILESQKRMSSAVENLNSISNLVSQFHCQQESSIQNMCDDVNQHESAWIEVLEQSKQGQFKILDECKEHLAKHLLYLNDWREKTSENFSDCVNIMEKFITEEITEDRPTGKTPQRQEFKYPRILAATSPHERILDRIRAEKVENALQVSVASSSASYSENSVISSETNNLNQIGKYQSKSTTNISDKPDRISFPCRSESDITSMSLDKENTSSLTSNSGFKSQVLKRRVLKEQNE